MAAPPGRCVARSLLGKAGRQQMTREAVPEVVVALEDWGFDDEAAAAWHRAKTKERRVAARRTAEAGNVLEEVRDVLLRDRGDEIALLPGFPDDWVGQSVTVHDAPTRAGRVSFAVRWHGPRPALLWDAPSGVELRASALDAVWSSKEPSGEVLLAAPPAQLLAMGAADRSAGAPVAAPGEAFVADDAQ